MILISFFWLTIYHFVLFPGNFLRPDERCIGNFKTIAATDQNFLAAGAAPHYALMWVRMSVNLQTIGVK